MPIQRTTLTAGSLSVSGEIQVNGEILVLDGTTDDWSLFAFPTEFRTPPEGASDKDNVLMGVSVHVRELVNKKGWKVVGEVLWRRGQNWNPETDNTSASLRRIAYLAVRTKLPTLKTKLQKKK